MVSVIVINHNTAEMSLKCLEQLYESYGVDLEVIAINNTIEDEFSKIVKKKFPEIRLIENKKPLGFGANNNQAMKVARGEYLLLLNSDAFVEPETVTQCLRAMKDYEADVVGCRLVGKSGETEQSWGYFPTLRRVMMTMSFVDNLPLVRKFVDSVHVRDIARYNKTQEVEWVQGAFMLLKKGVFENTGGFDEKIHMYGEEVEWEYRIKSQGFKVLYFADARCMHLVGASVKSKAKIFLSEMEGFRYFFQKHRPKWEQVVLPWVQLVGVVIRIPAWAVWGKWELVRAYTEVLPKLIKELWK